MMYFTHRYSAGMGLKFLSMADKQRLRDGGDWAAFLARRESLKAEGMEARDAAATALLEFPPKQPKSTEPAAVIARKMATHSNTRHPRTTFESRECTPKDTVDWVARNIAVSDVDPKEAPSPEAWAILQWVLSSFTNQTVFWKDIWARMLPTRAQVEEDQRFRDDGREQMDLINSVRAASDQSAFGRRLAKEHHDDRS